MTVTFFRSHAFNEITWYMNLYFIGAYLRQRAGVWVSDRPLISRWLAVTVTLSAVSILAIDVVCSMLQKGRWNTSYYFLMDSSKILAVAVSIAVFLFFRNLPLEYSRRINTVARTTFGVLCIHAHSDSMRVMLWKDIARVPDMLQAPLPLLVFHAAVTAFLVFWFCSFLDYLRLRFLEPPVMDLVYRYTPQVETKAGKLIASGKRWSGWILTMGRKY